MAKVMKFPGSAIVPGSIAGIDVNGKPYGFQFQLRLKYYRGLFLSCTDAFLLSVDGSPVDPMDIVFCLNGKEFGISLLPELISEFWLVTDPADVLVRLPCGLPTGQHELALTFLLRSPYLPNFDSSTPNRYVQIDNSETCTCMIGEGSAQ